MLYGKIKLVSYVLKIMLCYDYENINQEHNLLPDCALMPGVSAFILNLNKSGNILFRSMPNGNYLFSSASLSHHITRRYNSLVHVESWQLLSYM